MARPRLRLVNQRARRTSITGITAASITPRDKWSTDPPDSVLQQRTRGAIAPTATRAHITWPGCDVPQSSERAPA